MASAHTSRFYVKSSSDHCYPRSWTKRVPSRRGFGARSRDARRPLKEPQDRTWTPVSLKWGDLNPPLILAARVLHAISPASMTHAPVNNVQNTVKRGRDTDTGQSGHRCIKPVSPVRTTSTGLMSLRLRRRCCPLPLTKCAAHHLLLSLRWTHPTCISERRMGTPAPPGPTWRRRRRWSGTLVLQRELCVVRRESAVRLLWSPRSRRETTRVEQEVTHREALGMFYSHIVEQLGRKISVCWWVKAWNRSTTSIK